MCTIKYGRYLRGPAGVAVIIARSLSLTPGKGSWLRVIMGEGRKRQIRETGSTLGLPVVRIIRTRIGTLHLGSLKPGEWRPLTQGEIDELKASTESPRHDTRDPRINKRTAARKSAPIAAMRRR